MKESRFPVPRIEGDYVPIYRPAPAVYNGIDTEHFRRGEFYPEWIVNDFSLLREDNRWQMVGITHPRVPGFLSAYEYEGNVHEAEYQLFRAEAEGSFSSLFRPESFAEREKILYPQARPGEQPETWAPQLLKRGNTYGVIYSPHVIRMAESTDWEHWKIHPLFTCGNDFARDPFLFEEEGCKRLIYTMGGTLYCRTTEDFVQFSEEAVLQERLLKQGEPESPFLFRRKGIYYLVWSLYDGRNGCYDNRTFVFAGNTLEELRSAAPVTMLRAHAPEFVFEGEESWILSVFYPENGVSAARLVWDD